MNRPAVLTGLVWVLTLVAVLVIALSSFTEFDFWWYLKSAEVILQARSVPAVDPFSYTAHGRPWINHMWASQLAAWALWQAGGRVLLVVVKGLVVAATFAVVLATMRSRGVHPVVASGATLLAAWAGWQFWDVRPQIVTYLLLAVYLHLLGDGWPARARRLVWLPVLMVPWANLHAGFVTGLGVIGLVGAGSAVPCLLDRDRRRDGCRILALGAGLVAVTALATLVNPYGVDAVLFPLEVVNTVPFMSSTAEWLSPNFHDPAYRGFELMLLLLVPAFGWGRGRLGLTDVFVALTFAHLALASARHVPLFAVATAPLLADALQAAGLTLWRSRPPAWRPAARLARHLPSLWPYLRAPGTPLVVLAFCLLVGVVGGAATFLDPLRNPFLQDLNERRYPQATMTFIKQERLPPPLFNAYAWGGYELWRLYPEYRLFIDGRTHVYGRAVLEDFIEVTTFGARWRDVLDRWGIQTVLAARPSRLAHALPAVGGWRLVFAEREAAVFVRETDSNRALLARLAAGAPGSTGSALAPVSAGRLIAAGAGDRAGGADGETARHAPRRLERLR